MPLNLVSLRRLNLVPVLRFSDVVSTPSILATCSEAKSKATR